MKRYNNKVSMVIGESIGIMLEIAKLIAIILIVIVWAVWGAIALTIIAFVKEIGIYKLWKK